MAGKLALASGIDTTHGFMGKVEANPLHGPVSSVVEFQGTGFPAEATLQLVWETYDLDWKLETRDGVAWNEFLGLESSPRYELLCEVRTSRVGAFHTSSTIPEDYGGFHDIYVVASATGRKLNKCGFFTDVSAEMDVDQGPLGTPITLTVRGLNPEHPLEGWYQLCYDNHITGYITAVRTRGTAVVEVPAVGRPGPHLLTVEKASFGEPFLGVATTPFYYTKTFDFRFELLEGEPVMPAPIREQVAEEVDAVAPEPDGGEPKLWIDPAAFPARLAYTIQGVDFPPDCEVSLWWNEVHGDRVSQQIDGSFGTGFQESAVRLADVKTDDTGRLQARLVHEGTQGGPHAIEARCGHEVLAKGYALVSRRPHPIKPKSGPVGTPIEIEVEGVGWTEYENIVAVDYDNAYMGYKCGNDMMGRALIQFRAAGAPGWHVIDLYPAFYRNQNFADAMEMPFVYQKPILTWRDHPRGFHARYMFYVENDAEGAS